MSCLKFEPGDAVCILPEWWEHLASKSPCNQYVQRGKYYVYTVSYYGDDGVHLNEGAGWWSEEKLVPAFSVAESESEISIDGLI